MSNYLNRLLREEENKAVGQTAIRCVAIEQLLVRKTFLNSTLEKLNLKT
jgi:hypothetical protein